MGDDSARPSGPIRPSKALIITEGRPADRDFVRTIGERLGADPECLVLSSYWTVRAPKMVRHLGYFGAGARIARLGRRYRYLIFFQQAIAHHYAFWSLFRRAPDPVAVSPLILKPRRGAWGAVRARAGRAFVRSRRIDAFLVFSSKERDRYAGRFGPELAGKIRFVLLGGNVPLPPAGAAAAPPAGRHFSGGGSNRDYRTLFEAFSGMVETLVVCCSRRDIRGLAVPPGAEIVLGAAGEAFVDRLRAAYSVIVPLNAADFSSGQIALLQAMRHGKPIVVTQTDSVMDYVDGRSALFVRPGKAEDIAAAVRRLVADPGLAASLGSAARAAYEADFTAARFAERVSVILSEAENRRAGAPAGIRGRTGNG